MQATSKEVSYNHLSEFYDKVGENDNLVVQYIVGKKVQTFLLLLMWTEWTATSVKATMGEGLSMLMLILVREGLKIGNEDEI